MGKFFDPVEYLLFGGICLLVGLLLGCLFFGGFFLSDWSRGFFPRCFFFCLGFGFFLWGRSFFHSLWSRNFFCRNILYHRSFFLWFLHFSRLFYCFFFI